MFTSRSSRFVLALLLSLIPPMELLGCAVDDGGVPVAGGARAVPGASTPGTVQGPDGRWLPIQNAGLPTAPTASSGESLTATAGVPPSGEGIAPIDGAGGDGAPVVTQVGGWSSGPGAVRWHGGQWLIPYGAAPGSTLTNMFCDVVPRADATDTMELVGAAGVIGTATVPATTGVVIRAWILPANGGYTVPDGGQIVVRHSPRDSATGAYTSAAQDMTIIGCAVRTIVTSCTLNVNYASTTSPSLGIVSSSNCDPASGDTGALSVMFGGQTTALGAWNPVCGTKSGISLGINFGTATYATFTLAIASSSGLPVTSCSTVLAVRSP